MAPEHLANLARIGQLKVGWPPHRWRVLDAAHQKRNLAEYEGYLDIEESLVVELNGLVQALIADVESLMQTV